MQYEIGEGLLQHILFVGKTTDVTPLPPSQIGQATALSASHI